MDVVGETGEIPDHLDLVRKPKPLESSSASERGVRRFLVFLKSALKRAARVRGVSGAAAGAPPLPGHGVALGRLNRR